MQKIEIQDGGPKMAGGIFKFQVTARSSYSDYEGGVKSSRPDEEKKFFFFFVILFFNIISFKNNTFFITVL